ncbi:MAG: ATP phosphoribosyltransferase regulatory subunit [Desulfitobacterium sp.]|nr:ATP phosphoribosyltransferase regulatory subunit [Desulfitobacterium sp.]
MKRTSLGLKTPGGMKDLLPEELMALEQGEEKILSLFQNWAYQKVLTPTLEYGACIQPLEEEENPFLKLFDRQGHVLILRPELTTPIARMVNTRMRSSVFPLRLCYGADVFRYSPSYGHEFRQLGVELIGSPSPVADAEVIALAVEALQEVGREDFQISLGHMGIFTGFMNELNLTKEFRGKYEEMLGRKDYVGIERLVRGENFESKVEETLLKFPHLHGKEEMLQEVLTLSEEPSIKNAVESLRQVYSYLQDFGVQEYVSLDLGILRGFSYYTGVVFEGYVPGVGFPVVEGGRYDALYEEFGDDHPATGFAINLKALVEQTPVSEVISADVLVYGDDLGKVIQEGQKLRQGGQRVEISLEPMTASEAEKLAEEKGIQRIQQV